MGLPLHLRYMENTIEIATINPYNFWMEQETKTILWAARAG